MDTLPLSFLLFFFMTLKKKKQKTKTKTKNPQFLRNCKAFFKEKYACMNDKLLQLCLTLSHPMDCSPAASAIHGILLTQGIKSTSYISCIVRQVLYH